MQHHLHFPFHHHKPHAARYDEDMTQGSTTGHLLRFALPLLAGDSTLLLIPPVESRSYIEMTRAAQRRFGVESRWQDENTLAIPGGQTYHPCD